MGTENNADEAAQAKIDALEADKTAKEAEIAKLQKMNEDAQKQIGTQANEIGDVRKDYAEIKDALATLKASKQVPPDSGNTEDETVEEIEKALDEDQRKMVEIVWNDLTPEEKILFEDDDKFKSAVLKKAQSEVRSVPDSPWAKPTAKKVESNLDKRLELMFDKAKKSADFVPNGPASGRNSSRGNGGRATKRSGDEEDGGLPQSTQRILGHGAR